MRTAYVAGRFFNSPVKSIPPKQAAYLLDIFHSIEVIQSSVAGQACEEFLKDGKIQDAVLRRILVAGEAAARLSLETCAKFPPSRFTRFRACVTGSCTITAMWTFRSFGRPSRTTCLRSSKSWSRSLPNAGTPERTTT